MDQLTYNERLRYDIVPAEKTLDNLADELSSLMRRYKRGYIDQEEYNNLIVLIEAKQDQVIKQWQRQTGLCFYTGVSLDKKKLLEKTSKQRNKRVIKPAPINEQVDNKPMGLFGWAIIWFLVMAILGA